MVSELFCQKAGAPRIGFPKPGVSLQEGLLRQSHQTDSKGFHTQLPTLVLLVRKERDIDCPSAILFLCLAFQLVLET